MKKDWFKDWFASDEYLRVYKHRDDKDAKLFAETFKAKYSLSSDDVILDAACGAGRYQKIFASQGYNIVGFDLSMPLLKKAYQKLSSNNIKAGLVNADIRFTPFQSESFSLIINMFTSFGYFEEDAQNLKFLKDARNYLKKSGIFVLDYLNYYTLIENLVPYSQKEIDGREIHEYRKIENGRVVKDIVIKHDGEEVTFQESVKLYTPEWLKENIESIGYKILDVWGDYSSEKFDKNNSNRVIFILQK